MKKLIALLLAMSPTTTAFAQNYKYENNLSNVIYSFMLDIQNKDANIQDWKAFGDPSIHILWQTDGIESCRTKDDGMGNQNFSFCRYGKVILQERGKPILTALRQNVEPWVWSVTARGAHMGVSEVEISSDGNSQEMPSRVLDKYRGFLNVQEKAQCGDASGPYYLYLINAPRKKQAIAVESMSYGSGGGSDSIYIFYDTSNINLSYISLAGKCHKIPN